MEPAPELAELTLRLYEAASRGDVDLLEGMLSQQPGMVFIGTDPKEWWEDVASMRQAIAAQAGAGITVVPGETRSYREGDIGWVAGRAAFRLPDGTEVPARMTAVFRREGAGWKVVQGHASIGISNEEAIGVDL